MLYGLLHVAYQPGEPARVWRDKAALPQYPALCLHMFTAGVLWETQQQPASTGDGGLVWRIVNLRWRCAAQNYIDIQIKANLASLAGYTVQRLLDY